MQCRVEVLIEERAYVAINPQRLSIFGIKPYCAKGISLRGGECPLRIWGPTLPNVVNLPMCGPGQNHGVVWVFFESPVYQLAGLLVLAQPRSDASAVIFQSLYIAP